MTARPSRSAIAALRGLKSVDAVFYAMKANSNREILKLVDAGGLNFECVSPGEIARVLEVRARASTASEFCSRRISRRATSTSKRSSRACGSRSTTCSRCKHWAKSFKGKDLFVRIDTGQGRGHHEHVRTAGVHSKFGIPLFEIDDLLDSRRESRRAHRRLHAHTGSGVLSANAWLETGRQLLKLLEKLPEVRYIDVGGGLGVPEKAGQPGLDLAALDAALAEVKQGCGGRSLFLEPGRFIVAQAGVIVARVTQTKGKGDVQYVGVGTGMNSLIRPGALWRLSRDREPHAARQACDRARDGRRADLRDGRPAGLGSAAAADQGERRAADRERRRLRLRDELGYNLREPAVEVLI